MAKQIKADVREVSLAINPANRKKFLMTKEECEMDELVKILQGKDPLEKEQEVDAVLTELAKSQTMEDDVKKAVKGSLLILGKYKDRLPKDIMSHLAKSVSEYEALAEPIRSDEDLKKEKEAIRKELETTLEKEIREKLEKEGNGGMDQALKKELEDLKKESSDLKAQVETEKDARRRIELKQFAKDKGYPGDLDKIAESLLALDKTNPEMRKQVEATLDEAASALHSAGIFSELGSSAGGRGGETAYTKLKKMVDEKMSKDDNANQASVWESVIQENSELYKEYCDERESQIRANS